MKKILLMLIIGAASFSFADALDEAAFSLYRGEVSESALKNTFSKSDFQLIVEKYRNMKLEKAKKEAEQQKVNELLKKRNEELEQEIKKIKDVNSLKKANIKRITIDEAVKNTFMGLYGDNPDRVNKLRNLGFNSKEIQEIQRRVNKLVEEDKKNKE